jgi:hypothetical protein
VYAYTITSLLLTATLGNFHEVVRFKVAAWRLVALLPKLYKKKGKYEALKVDFSVRNARLWHMCMAKIFKGYNKNVKNGVWVQCADGLVRHFTPRIAMWLTDVPEGDCSCQMVGVSVLCVYPLCTKWMLCLCSSSLCVVCILLLLCHC